jgi:amt: ammonium transporter
MVAGLVGITPGAGFVPMWAAVIIGLTTSPVCYIMISYGKKKFGFDDALDAFSCHGTGGIWGGLLTGVFSCTAINSSAGNGLVYGEFAQFSAQAAGIGITIVIAVVGTLICYGITRLLTGKIRVDLRDELMGLDVSQHGESAYPSFNGLDN